MNFSINKNSQCLSINFKLIKKKKKEKKKEAHIRADFYHDIPAATRELHISRLHSRICNVVNLGRPLVRRAANRRECRCWLSIRTPTFHVRHPLPPPATIALRARRKGDERKSREEKRKSRIISRETIRMMDGRIRFKFVPPIRFPHPI